MPGNTADTPTWRIALPLGLLSALVLGLLGLSFHITHRMVVVYTPQIKAAMQIKYEVSQAHALLHHALQDGEFQPVFARLDQADGYARALQEGGSNPEREIYALQDTTLLATLGSIRQRIREMRRLTEELREFPDATGVAQITGTGMQRLLKDADGVEADLQSLLVSRMADFQRLQIFLMVLAVLAGLGTLWLLLRYRRQSLAHAQGLTKANEILRDQAHARQVSEQALAGSEARLRAITDSLRDALIMLDDQGRVAHWSPGAERMFGFSVEEALGRPFHDWLVPERYRHEVWPAFHRFSESGQGPLIGQTTEVFALHRDGHELPVEVTLSALRMNERWHSLGLMRDITASRRATHELQRFKETLDHTADGILMSDPSSYRLTYTNRGMTALSGYTSEQLASMSISQLSPAWTRHRLNQLFNSMRSDDRDSLHMEAEIQRQDGTPLPVAVTAQYLCPEDQSPRIVAFLRDITDAVRHRQEMLEARQAAEAAARSKSEFLASMSHEIRTPMNGVLGMAELLCESGLSVEQHEYAEVILNSGQALLTILNDILDFSKIEAGRLELSPVGFDLERAVHDVCRLLAVRAKEKDLELIVDYAPDTPRHFEGDAGRLRQILLNLVGNAIKFTAKGHVRIGVRSPSQSDGSAGLRIEVQDTGIGIDAQTQGRLFQAFTQADASTTRRYGGTGLGLAISRRLMELMHGRIGVDSVPNRGSTFWLEFSLPVLPEAPRLPEADLCGIRCLLVDDNPVNRRVLSGQLGQFGLEVETAEQGRQALEMLRAARRDGRPYGVGALDHMMPEMDGEQLARVVRADPELAGLPLVLFTSGGQRGDAARFEAAGFDAYLVKPVPPEILRRSLAGVIGARQQGCDIPLVTRHHVAEAATLPPVPQREIRGRVLLAEDNPVNRKVARTMLNRLGVEVESAEDGQQAVRLWAAGHFDLIFMDCQMPVMDGYEATRVIRCQENNQAHIPIVALTANAMETDRQRCVEAGMDGHVAKPFTGPQLVATLQRWLPGAQDRGSAPAGDPPPLRVSPDQVEQGEPAIDTAALDSLREAMGEGFAELIPTYLESTQCLLDELVKAQADGDLDTAQRLAHSLKSSSANLGAMTLSDMGRELESRIREQRKADPDARIDAMQHEFERVRQALAEQSQ